MAHDYEDEDREDCGSRSAFYAHEEAVSTLQNMGFSVNSACTLIQLRDRLIALEQELTTQVNDGTIDSDTGMDEFVNLYQLPIFGGTEPEDTSGIYSWDKDHILRHDRNGGTGWVIELREDQ